MNFRFCLLLLFLLCPLAALSEEDSASAAAKPAAAKVVLDPAAKEDAKAIVDSARPAGASEFQQEKTEAAPLSHSSAENSTNVTVRSEAKVPQKVETPKEKKEKNERINVAMDIAVWQKVYLESETQCVWRAESDSIVEDLLTSVQAPATITFGPKDLLRIDYGGELAYRADYSNGILSVSFTGSPLSDKRLLRPFEYPWDDLLGIPIQGSLTNYYTGAFRDGELWRYDFVLLPEAQLRLRKDYNQYSYVALRRHVWFDKTKQRIVKTYRRALDGSETTLMFKVEE
ncbi:hypothetical protein IKW72_02390 [bacterium]|nr:hypothetical protein [bacterium]